MNKIKGTNIILISAFAITIIAGFIGMHILKKKYPHNTKDQHKKITEDNVLKSMGQILFTKFIEEHGPYFLKKEKEGYPHDEWAIYFPQSSPHIKVKIPSQAIYDEMYAFSKSYSYKHLKDKKVDVQHDKLIQKGVVMSLFVDKEDLVVQKNQGGFQLMKRDILSEERERKWLETGKRDMISLEELHKDEEYLERMSVYYTLSCPEF